MDRTEREDLCRKIRRYGAYRAEFDCIDENGTPIRIRAAEYDGKKYFIVIQGGNIRKISEI